MRGRRVLVTGGAGFLGRELCRVLSQHPAVEAVAVLDVAGAPFDGPVTWRQGDASRFDDVLRTCKEMAVDSVIALAALLPEEAQADPYRAVHVNILGVTNVLETARLLGLRRVVIASSIAVHGVQKGQTVYDEDSPMEPAMLYGATKAAVEQIASAFRQRGVDAVVVRPGFVFGPGRQRGVGAWADQFVIDAVRHGQTEIPCRSDQEILYTYVGWVAEVMGQLALADHLPHSTFHTGGLTVTAWEIGQALQTCLPGTVVRYRESAPPLPFISRVNSQRIEQLLGRPHPPLLKCMEEHVMRVKSAASWSPPGPGRP